MDANVTTLQWYKEMGVDEAIAEAPLQQEVKQEAVPSQESIQAPVQTEIREEIKPMPTVPKPAVIESPQEAIVNTKKIADSCETLEELREAVCSFNGLSITKTATNTVFADGNPEAKVMVIGEAPGANEDQQGIPFCGMSGQLMDIMFSCIGLSRKENIYISNTIFWRPPGNRRPTPEELAICKPFVERHIYLMQPKLLILVGGTATAGVLNSTVGITKLRGKFYDYSNQYLLEPIKTGVLFHPSYLLRQPLQKKVAWQDLLQIKETIEEMGVL